MGKMKELTQDEKRRSRKVPKPTPDWSNGWIAAYGGKGRLKADCLEVLRYKSGRTAASGRDWAYMDLQGLGDRNRRGWLSYKAIGHMDEWLCVMTWPRRMDVLYTVRGDKVYVFDVAHPD